MLTELPIDVRPRLGAAVPFAALGAVAIVAGGIAAAAAGPAGWDKGSWVAAYLVLVLGVGQIGLGVGQAFLGARPTTWRVQILEITAWNIGSLAVIGGTLATLPSVVSLGGALMMVTLLLCVVSVRATPARYRWAARSYVVLIVILVVSIPIGLTLSWLNA